MVIFSQCLASSKSHSDSTIKFCFKKIFGDFFFKLAGTLVMLRMIYFQETQLGSVTHQMAVPVPSISCCVLNHLNWFYQIHNALAFNQDMCCHLFTVASFPLAYHVIEETFYFYYTKSIYTFINTLFIYTHHYNPQHDNTHHNVFEVS